jgi:lipid-binding SYLF domain-containing protein
VRDQGLPRTNRHATAPTNQPPQPTAPTAPPPRGFIVDVSLKGTSLEHDVDDMEAAYGAGTTPADVLTGSVRPPAQAQLLYNALAAVEARVGMCA